MGFFRWVFLGFFGWVFLGGFFNANPAARLHRLAGMYNILMPIYHSGSLNLATGLACTAALLRYSNLLVFRSLSWYRICSENTVLEIEPAEPPPVPDALLEFCRSSVRKCGATWPQSSTGKVTKLCKFLLSSEVPQDCKEGEVTRKTKANM